MENIGDDINSWSQERTDEERTKFVQDHLAALAAVDLGI